MPIYFFYSHVAWIDTGVCPHNRPVRQELKNAFNRGLFENYSEVRILIFCGFSAKNTKMRFF